MPPLAFRQSYLSNKFTAFLKDMIFSFDFWAYTSTNGQEQHCNKYSLPNHINRLISSLDEKVSDRSSVLLHAKSLGLLEFVTVKATALKSA